MTESIDCRELFTCLKTTDKLKPKMTDRNHKSKQNRTVRRRPIEFILPETKHKLI